MSKSPSSFLSWEFLMDFKVELCKRSEAAIENRGSDLFWFPMDTPFGVAALKRNVPGWLILIVG